MKADITPISDFDISHYLGRWYEVGRFDHRFERGLCKVTADYTQNADGTIKVVNTGFDSWLDKQKQIAGKAKLTITPGLLRVSFFWFFYSDYRVLALGDNYEWALVGGGRSLNYLWILSRTPELPDSTVATITAEAKRRGYDPLHLLFPEPAKE